MPPLRNMGNSPSFRRGRSQTGPPGIAGSQSGASGRPRPTERLAKSGRPHGAVPTVETDHPHNRERSPHPSGLRPAPLSLLSLRDIFPRQGESAFPFRGRLSGRVRTPAPTVDTETIPFSLQGAGPGTGPRAHTVRPYSGNGPPRRRNGTAATAIFANSGPSGPKGIASKHS